MMGTISTEVIELIDNSKYPNDLQNSRKPLDTLGVKRNSTDEKKTQEANGEFQEHSQNSQMELAVKSFEIKFEERPTEK